MMRIMLVAILAITLTAPLAACGKQGPLRLPMAGGLAPTINGVAG
jgi:predicted small lipoprotein YifL